MSFTPAPLETLAYNAKGLMDSFNVQMGRYQIVSAPNAAPATPFDLLIARANVVAEAQTGRASQQEVFRRLVDELRLTVDVEARKQATLFLLGALLHRYFRLIDEYKTSNKPVDLISKPLSIFSFGFFTLEVAKSEVRSCRLFQQIRLALRLPDSPVDSPLETCLENDLKKLDAKTVVDALECFKRNMLLEDRYKKYPHLAQDKNFQTHLDEIIAVQKARNVDLCKETQVITYVQTLVDGFAKEQEKINALLDKWLIAIKAKYTNFKSTTLELIDTHMDAEIDDPIKEKILLMLGSQHITDNFEKMKSFDDLVAHLKKGMSTLSEWRIIGGCSLILSSPHISKELKHCIQVALQIDAKPEELDDEASLRGTKYLIHYFANKPTFTPDASLFEDFAQFQTKLASHSLALSVGIQKKEELAKLKKKQAEEQAPANESSVDASLTM